jgi:hypothetical protein
VESKLFPTDIEQAKVQLRLGGMERPKDTLVKSVIDNLVFSLFEGAGPLKGQLRAIVAIRATYDLFPGLCEPRLRHTLNSLGRRVPDDSILLFFGLQRRLGQTWDFLDPDNQSRITEYLKQSADEIAKRLIPAALGVPALTRVCDERTATLGYEALGEMIRNVKPASAIERAVDIYCSSKSWDAANTHYTHVVEPILDDLSNAQIERILLASANEGADLNGAHSFLAFARHMYNGEKLPKTDMVKMLREKGLGWVADRLEREEKEEDDGIPF